MRGCGSGVVRGCGKWGGVRVGDVQVCGWQEEMYGTGQALVLNKPYFLPNFLLHFQSLTVQCGEA